MNHRDEYLRQQILSASGPKLRYLLIDRATRLTTELAESWTAQQFDRSAEVGERLRRILFELWSTVDRSEEAAAQPMAALYHFLIGELAIASIRRDAAHLAQVRELLEYERQTWSEVCQKLASSPPTAPTAPGTTGGASPSPIGIPAPKGRIVRSA